MNLLQKTKVGCSTAAVALLFGLSACGNSGETPATTASAAGTVSASQFQQTPTQIILRSASGQVEVDKKPLKIRFLNKQGKIVLQQVAGIGNAVEPGLVLDEPGSDYIPDQLLSAPFTYLVGTQASPQMPGTPWVGNYITQLMAGVQYYGVEVTDSKTLNGALSLTIATNDPSGRIIQATIKPSEENSFEVSMQVSPSDGVVFVADNFQIQANETFHGFGGRHNAIDQRGKSLTNFIQAQNIGAGPLQPVAGPVSGSGDTYLFPTGEDAAYYISTAFVSTAGYGFMLDSTKPSRYNLGAANPNAWQINNFGAEMTYLVVPETETKAVKRLSAIQGRHRVPEQGDLGPTLSRAVRVLSPDADTAATYEAKIYDDLKNIDADQLPVKGYAFEGWELLSRDTSKAIIQSLHDRGIRAYLYIRNYVGLDPANTERPETFTDAVTNGYVATNAAGQPYLFGTPFGGLGAAIDFTNPEAVNWWNGRIKEMAVDLGADGFMQDFGEHIALDMHFHDGSTGVTMHNLYPTLFHQATRKVLDQVQAQTGRKVFFWTRAGYSGRKGSSAYESSNFPGDETSDWSRSSGLASLTTDMLSRSTTGAYGFNTDIGGYFDYHTGAPDAELFTRWSFWAALSPVFRVHNSSSNGVRMPWFYGEETLQHWRKAANLHLAAAPLIMKLWQEAQSTGLPPTRGLWMQYPDDPRAREEDQEWLLGPDVLVAPVVTQGATSRNVYLPKGCWTHVETGVQYNGPADVNVPAPIDSLPYFFKCGTQPF